MDNFREWVSDNLRYIMLIVAVAVVVAIAFFTIRFIGNRSSAKEAQQEVSQEVNSNTSGDVQNPSAVGESLTPAEDQSQLTADVSNELRENDPIEVGNLVRSYYEALSNKDIPSLRNLVDFISDDDVAALVTDKTTTFSSVTPYMKKGADPDTYVAYAYYRYSNDQATDMPGLSQLYVVKKTDGSYVVKSEELSEKEQALVDSLNSDPEVQQLIYKVQKEYEDMQNPQGQDAAEAAGENEEAGESSGSGDQNADESGSSEESSGSEDQNNEDENAGQEEEEIPRSSDEVWTSTIVKDCNVRDDASYKGKVLGVISEGTEVTVYGNADSGWYHISGGGYDGFVGHSFVR